MTQALAGSVSPQSVALLIGSSTALIDGL